MLVDPRHTVFLSAVSGVEIAIKRVLGKLRLPPAWLTRRPTAA